MKRLMVNTTTVCRLIGFVAGLTIIIGAFLPWYGPVQRVNELFGLQVYSADELFGFDFTTIICGTLYLFFLAAAHKGWIWKTLGVMAGGISLIISGYNFWRFSWVLPQAEVLIGLKLTLIASLLATAAVLPIRRENDSTPARTPDTGSA